MLCFQCEFSRSNGLVRPLQFADCYVYRFDDKCAEYYIVHRNADAIEGQSRFQLVDVGCLAWRSIGWY